MNYEYMNDIERAEHATRTAENLAQARLKESQLLAAGKISARRLDAKTIVIASKRTYRRIQKSQEL